MTDSNSLERAVGKLLIGRLAGPELDNETKDLLQSGIISGITLFKENAVSVEQLLKLSVSIYRNCQGTPLFSVDQEGGAVQRLDHILSPLPAPMAVAAIGDLNAARQVLELCCKQLNAVGVNCLLAPVLDISSNPRNPIIGTRSYGSEPSTVTSLGLTVATTTARFGIMAVGKHFPGHGATHEDSHLQLAVNRSDAAMLWERDLVPFRGCAVHLPAIMVGHIWVPAVDRDTLPATLSPKVITALLREYLQFDGLIMTDDLLMKAVTDKWGLEEASVRSVEAGAEQLLALGSTHEVRSVHAAIVKAVRNGRIAEWQIEQAVERIESSRRELSVDPRLLPDGDLDSLAAELHDSLSAGNKLSLAVATSAVGMLRGELPRIESGEWVVVAPKHPRYALELEKFLKQALKKNGQSKRVKVSEIRYPLNPSAKECRSIVESCAERHCIFLTYRTLSNTGQVRLGKALSESKMERVTVACDVPYDLIGLPDWNNCMATFDPSDLAMEALSIVMTGNMTPEGSCPVSLQTEII
jgi:beta-N-acetylhexosaminidase